MKFLIADDHGLFRDSLAVWLQRIGGDIRIRLAGGLDMVTELLDQEGEFDLVMLDLGMPGMRGASSIRQLCARNPATPFIVVSADESPLTIRCCLEAGARGYVTKSSEGDTILDAARKVLAGGHHIPPAAARQFTQQPEFTERQMHLLSLLARGLSNRDIARQMHLSEGTVKQYVSKILRILDVDNRMQAGIRARKLLGLDNG